MTDGDDIMTHPTGVGGDVLLSTLINHVASREGVIEAAELNLIFGILSSLSGRISPDAMAIAQAKLSAVMTAQQFSAEGHANPNIVPELQLRDAEQQQYESQSVSHIGNLAPQPDDVLTELKVDDQQKQAAASLISKVIITDYAVACADMLDQPHLDIMAQSPFETASSGIARFETSNLDTSNPETVSLVRHAEAFPAETMATDPLLLAATCAPSQLVKLALADHPSPQLCNLIVARGYPEALATMARNPAASFAKSSLTTMVELAASDFSIRVALCSRADLTDMILDRLWPYLSRSSKAAVIAAGCHESHGEAMQLWADLCEPDEADAPETRSVSGWCAAIEAREVTLCQAMRTLDSEGRIADVAMILAIRARVSSQMALTLMLGSYDRGAVALARLAGCDDDSLASLIHVRGRAGARGTSDKRGPLHAFSKMSEDEACEIIRIVDNQFGSQMADKSQEHIKRPPAAQDNTLSVAA